MSQPPSCTAPGNDYRPVAGWPEVQRPSVTVIVPVYNRVELLDRTLAGLRAQSYDLFDVVVADDGSTEDVSAVVARHEQDLNVGLVRQAHEGFGLARARNLGAAAAAGDVFLFLDADCIPDPQLVERHAAWHGRAANLVVAGTRRDIDSSALTVDAIARGGASLRSLIGADSDDEPDVVPDGWRGVFYRRTRKLTLSDAAFRAAIGANLSLRRERFEAVGGYSSRFTQWGGEDTEFNWRVWNDGAFFVPDNRAIAYHQVQLDRPASDDDRRRSGEQVAALVADLVPHRFYRKLDNGFATVPKVSWWVRVENADEAQLAWREASYATFTDTEFLLTGPHSAVRDFQALASHNPRVTVINTDDGDPTRAAVTAARGELIAMLDGRTRINRDILRKAVAYLDEEARATTVQSGYRFSNGDRYLHRSDLLAIDDEVGRQRLPLFAVVKRRELMKDWDLLDDASEMWKAAAGRDTHPRLIVNEPATIHADAPDRDMAATARELIAAGPQELARKAVRRARSSRRTLEEEHAVADDRVPVAYVGLTGKRNLGDDAVLAAVERLMPWAHFGTNHANPKLLMVGGGTLINGRGYYLNKMIRQDVPTVERAMFGTGVRNPDFWGLTEPMEDWIAFLDGAILQGVRGPDSIDNLRKLGYDGPVEILGDPALSLRPPEGTTKVEGRVVVCPLHTGGNLHGGDDAAVLGALIKEIHRLRSAGHEVVMLSAYPEDDRWIIGMMDEVGANLPYLAGYADLDAAMALLASADLVIGERLHAAILAASCATPFVALQYRPKVLDFTKSVAQEAATVRTDLMDQLPDVVDEVLANRAGVVAALERELGRFRSLQEQAAGSLEAQLRQ